MVHISVVVVIVVIVVVVVVSGIGAGIGIRIISAPAGNSSSAGLAGTKCDQQRSGAHGQAAVETI